MSRVQIPRNVSLDDGTWRILKHEGEEVGLPVSALIRTIAPRPSKDGRQGGSVRTE